MNPFRTIGITGAVLLCLVLLVGGIAGIIQIETARIERCEVARERSLGNGVLVTLTKPGNGDEITVRRPRILTIEETHDGGSRVKLDGKVLAITVCETPEQILE